MEMTIEQDIKVIRKMLAYTDLSVRANLHADMVDACEDAIDIMCKYQKIEKILSDWINDDSVGMSDYWMGRIKEVMENGNDK